MPIGARSAAVLDSSAPLILHVTEAMGGGLENAIYDFVRSAPQYRHALLFARRGAFETAETRPDNLIEVVDAGRGFRALNEVYGTVVDRLEPDVIHLHSAWAGLIGRVRGSGPRRAAIVYSPHSYYFERRDLALPIRALAWLLEWALSARTGLTAAVSPAEAGIARRLGSSAAYIPNVVRLPGDLSWTGAGTTAAEVVMIGRVTAQKDPKFFLQVMKHAASLAPDVRWTWIGSGDTRMEQRLRAAGVDVTGWMTRSDCLARMRRAGVYLHTAAWEGSPITLLEAAEIGVPIVARSIPALDSLGFDPTLRSPRAVAEALIGVLAGARMPIAPPATAPTAQMLAIGQAYAAVLPVSSRSRALRPLTLDSTHSRFEERTGGQVRAAITAAALERPS
ncbi:glycosyltransferase [uncultured Amnibacterium sp.]|uniref:glycosyltransferase n=1 Tax=uncultured Amnibacterium sp. TaxID=1631851 RepID=UPI0035CBF66A